MLASRSELVYDINMDVDVDVDVGVEVGGDGDVDVGVGETQEQAARRIVTELAEACGQLNLAHARLAGLVGEAVAHHLGASDSITRWLCWRTGLSTGHVRQLLRVAAAADTHPAVSAGFAAGLLSIDQTDIAVRAPEHLDGEFARLARLTTIPQLQLLVRVARPTPPAPEPGVERSEELSTFFDDDGRMVLRGRLDADHGRIVDQALSEARDALFHDGEQQVSWAEALVEIAHRSLDTIVEPARRDRFRSYLFLDPLHPVPVRWVDGIAVPDWLSSQLACDNTINPIYVQGGLPVSVGTAQASPPERTRRLILHRDGKCRVPWCTQTRWLQIHHVIHREHRGPTDTNNLAALCAHHRQHHRGQLGITGNADQPDGLTFTDRHGRTINPTAQPRPPSGPLPTPDPAYQHPLGERLDRWAIHFDHPPPNTN